jgi:hypothetical protein
MSITIGTTVRAKLSDAPEFTGQVVAVVDNGPLLGINYKLKRANGRETWVDDARITEVVAPL